MPQFFKREKTMETNQPKKLNTVPAPAPRPSTPRPLAANSAPANRPRSNTPRPITRRPDQRPARPAVAPRPTAAPVPAGPFNTASPFLKVLPLGGNGFVTQNMFVYEYGEDIVVVDCGMGFPSEELLGIDIVLPDITYLKDKLHRIKALVITHGHEDHIGAIPYLAPKLNVPIYAPKFALELIKYKFSEFNVKQDLHEIEPDKEYTFGPFTFKPFRVNHSIPDTFGYIIKTPVGTTIHTGDYKYDWTSVDGTIIEVDKLARAGGEGVLALMSDCLRIEKPGFTPSEAVVEDRLDNEMRHAKGRIFLTTISSNVTRIQQAINVAMRYNRKVAFAGRSIENVMGIATRLGYAQVPDGVIVRDTAISNLPDNQQLIVLTGAYGQEGSALARLTAGQHKLFAIQDDDLVVFSADPIPGSEDSIYSIIDELTDLGAKVAYSDILNNLHVSGHAAAEELKTTIGLTKPKFLMPISGMARQLKAYGQMGQNMGYPEDNIFIVEAGQEVLFDNQGHAKLGQKYPYNSVLVDGLGVGDVGEVVIADRQQLSESGVFIVAATINKNKELVGEIDLQTRGFIYARINEKLMEEAKAIVRSVITDQQTKNQDLATIKSRVQDRLGKYFKQQTDRTPIVLPMLLEVK
jgi:ribonuclease J